MPTPIATDIQGAHPYFLGVDEPEAFAVSAKWKVLAENNPRKAILQATFAPGQVLTMRVSATSAPKQEGNVAEFPVSSVATAKWVAHKEHVKLLVAYTQAPSSRTLTVDYTASGVTLLSDTKGGVDILAGATKVGALPKPWIEYAPDGAAVDEFGNKQRTRVYLEWATGLNSFSVTMPELSATEWQGAVLDPTVITTSTASTATAYSNQRKIDRTSNGVLWSAVSFNGYAAFYHSTDDGATWSTYATMKADGTGSSDTTVSNLSFFIDADDYAHVAWKQNGTQGSQTNGYIYYRRGTPNAARTAWTWSAAFTVFANSTPNYPDIVAHREGTGWAAHIVMSYASGTVTTRVDTATLNITSAGVVSYGGPGYTFTNSNNYQTGVDTYPSIDFNHTGDGKTVAGGTPHLYVAWSAGATGAGKGIRFKKATYSGGSWTWGTEREIDSTRYISAAEQWINCLYDGTRVIIGGELVEPAAGVDLVAYERDAGDTATTTRVLLNAPSGDDRLMRGSFSYDSNGSVYLIGAANASGLPISYRKWDRPSGTLGAKVSVDTGTAGWVSVKRGYSGNKIEFIYTDGTASPYSVTYSSIALAQQVAVNPVTETDTAQPLGRKRYKGIAVVTETDSAQPVGKVKIKLIGVAGETDAAQSVSKGFRIPMLWATEIDAAQAVGFYFTDVWYRFTPPTQQQSVRTGDRLFDRYSIPVGQSVVRVNGTLTVTPYPWLGDLDGLEDGVDYFLGGHDYTVNQDAAAELVAAGFTPVRI